MSDKKTEEPFDDEIRSFFKRLLESQVPLEDDFQKVLSENPSDLYEEEKSE